MAITMKRNNRDRKRFPNYSLGIVICGFLIVLPIAFFMSNYDNYNNRIRTGNFEELSQKYKVIKGDEIYEFMNFLFHKDSSTSELQENEKVFCLAAGHSKDIKNAIKELSDKLATQKDINHMLDQIHSETMLWDSTMLNSVWLLKPSDLAKINRSDTTDYWEEYRRLFGNGGKHYYSTPIFNQEKNLVLIEHSGSGGWELGSGGILVFEKVNNEWRYLKKISLWIS